MAERGIIKELLIVRKSIRLRAVLGSVRLVGIAAGLSMVVSAHASPPETARAYYSGSVRTPVSCTASAVQTTINAASSRDVVRMPSGCTNLGSGSISIPSKAGIWLDGLTAGGNISFGGTLRVMMNSSISTRISGFTFTRTGALRDATVQIIGKGMDARFRFDHNKMVGGGSENTVINAAQGLFDHCIWSGGSAADEVIHILGYGAGNATGWGLDHAPGSTKNAVVFEDNTMSSQPSNANPTWKESFYGAIEVFRYNTLTYFWLDTHGGNHDPSTGEPAVGGRWWEIYLNTFHGGSNGSCCLMNMRDGSGVIYGNTKGDGTLDFVDIGMCSEKSDPYPALYQIGRGKNHILLPVYEFLNNTINNFLDSCAGLRVAGHVQNNRDVYRSAGASCPAGGSCTTGIGSGTTLPATCTTNTGFWKTDAGGNWDTTHGGANDGALYKCASTNAWTSYWIPSAYPDPLQTTLN